ncbi:endospore germination permease [Oceanobacillus sp. Castelsardo]|uniref:GerAB/ArcD/ProY family transporter n=1 Tax=Oceanobacillus sp. Castelsardo TaxID=1851204 RepID=UPI0008389A79|nr:endospore germination permease [Oceanobacillus sp. Castelsardo]
MSTFKYGDKMIKTRDIMVLVPSMLIAVVVLSLPRMLAGVTNAADGWIPIVVSGIVAILLAWFVAKLASFFPNQSFLEYASSLVSKPIAVILTLLFALEGILITAFEVRAIGVISEQYLFRNTPIEIITLSFLWVVVYAVSGSRAGIFRLNSLFLPFIFIAVIILVFFSIGYMELSNVLPVFKTDVQGYMQGTMKSALSYSGIGVLFFYIAFVRQPKRAPGMAAVGMGFVVMLYVLIYFTCIAVFGSATEVLRLPIIDLAKAIEIPGGFFERIESVFYVIWIMGIFTTTAISFDIAVLAITLVFPKLNKIKVTLCLTPLIFIITTMPKDYIEVEQFGNYVSYLDLGLIFFVTILLWGMYLIRGVKKREK